jgi:beta-lactamase regulating signal transducer with metallopeptidase domain
MILQAFIRGAIIIAVAALLATLLRHRSAALRHHIWATAMIAQLAVLAFIPVLPTIRLPILPTVRAELDAPLAGTSAIDEASPAPSAAISTSSAAVGTGDVGAAPQSTSGPFPDTLALVWLIGAGLILVRYLVGTLVMMRVALKGERIEDGEWLVLAQRTARELGITRPVTMVWGEQVAVPITWGILYPMILLPRNAQEWVHERRRLVLVHEMAHVKRFDAFTQLLAQVTTAIFWFSPFVWLADRRLRIEREHACDDTVLRHGTEPSRYADELLQMVRTLVRRRTPQPAFAALAMARKSELEGRMLAILDPERPRRVTGITSGLSFALLSVVIAAPLAAVDPFAVRVTTAPPSHSVKDDGKVPVTEGTSGTTQMKSAAPAARTGEAPPERTLPVGAHDQAPPQQSDIELLDRILASMTSDNDLSRAMLSQITNRSNGEALRVFARHAGRMGSANEQRRFLIAAGPHYFAGDRRVRDAWFDAAGKISSDFERRMALVWAVPHTRSDPQDRLALLHASRTMGADNEKAAVLAEIARQKLITTAELRSAFLAEVGTLNADSHRRTVLEALQ